MKKSIPFSPPRIDEKIKQAVHDVLESGWITTGPRTKEFEKKIAEYCGVPHCVAVNSWTAGMEVVLRWMGIQAGDEVIIPAYTYCASANVVIHCGAKPVMVDTNPDDFNISLEAIKKAITPNTKAIMGVDIAGLPCDYDAIYDIVNANDVRAQFTPKNDFEQKLGRIAVLSDAAHSFGANYKSKKSGALADITVFSFHAVKNLTTAEGGAICLNLPKPFDTEEIYKELCIKILHGQSKDALAKSQLGNWRYDVVEPGFKCNMTDIQAAIGLIELSRYDSENLPRRREIFESYQNAFAKESWAILPIYKTEDAESSYHLFMLRVANCTEAQRDAIMQRIFETGVSVNVHFQPLPLLSAYKNLGYKIEGFPTAFSNYANEISLPVYYDLSEDDVNRIIEAVIEAVRAELC
jgi:dTDP-4-amino-4,6-dideoxygalactose transaminase